MNANKVLVQSDRGRNVCPVVISLLVHFLTRRGFPAARMRAGILQHKKKKIKSHNGDEKFL